MESIHESTIITDTFKEKGITNYVEFLIQRFKSDAEIIDLGPSGCRINPCPACGHYDCLTFNHENGVFQCFGCKVKGNVLSIANLFTEDQIEAKHAFKDFTGIDNLSPSPENDELSRMRKLFHDAAEIYHSQLMINTRAYDFLINERRRKPETIDMMKTGFCADRASVYKELIAKGYTDEEIKKVIILQGLFVYPYFDRYGCITRLNTKNYLHEAKDLQGNDIKGFSKGPRQLLYSPGKYDEAIVVEGEQDLASIIENGASNVVGTGGGPTGEEIESLRQFKKLYLCFDDDDGGKGFTQKVNEALPDIQIYCIHIPGNYKDIDEYYSKYSRPIPFNELMANAEKLENTDCVASVKKNTVYVKNRNWVAEFEITEYNLNKQCYKGNLRYYENGVIDFTKSQIIIPDNLPKKLLNYSGKFLDAIEKHFNSGFNNKELIQLDNIYYLSIKKAEIVNVAAKRLFDIEDKKMRDTELASLKDKRFKSEIFRKLIALDNENIKDEAVNFPVLNPCQAYVMGPEESIAYFYFNQIEKKENGKLIEQPCLLSSDKRIINLCDYVKETSNELLIVDGRFRIRNMIQGVVLETEHVSLKQEYVEKFRAGEVPSECLTPKYIIQSFEEMFRKVCYSKEPEFHKVLALFAYATYFADLFGVLPYLFFTSQKGSGKSTVMSMLNKFCFNSQFLTDCSEASFLRITNLCSTLLLGTH